MSTSTGAAKRLRAVLIVSVLWALISVGTASLIMLLILWGKSVGVENVPWLRLALNSARTGAISGLLFAVVLRWAGRQRHVGQLYYKRMAIWGGLAGGLFPAVTLLYQLAFSPVANLAYAGLAVAVGGLLGALWAVGTLRIARHGVTKDELVESEVGLLPGLP